jgi:Amt family ammonium transporter
MTFLLLKGLSLVMPLRVTEYEEALGMDTVQHGEEAYPTGEGAILVSPEAGIGAEIPIAQPN